MKNNRTNKPIKNFQKKKYYTNRNTRSNQTKEIEYEYYYNALKREWEKRIIN